MLKESMDINYRGKNWPPIYYDPEFEEVLTLTVSFDTLRIGIKTEKGEDHIVVASGLGSTHNSLARALGEMNPRSRKSRVDGQKYDHIGEAIILYEEDRRLWFNMCKTADSDKVPADEGCKWFKSPAKEILQDIINTAREQQGLL